MDQIEITRTVEFLNEAGFLSPEIGIVVGTGLSLFLSEIDVEIALEYDRIPGFVMSTVESHSGKLIYGTIAGKKVVVMSGRFHFYEGYTMKQVTFPIRVMKQLGVRFLLLSNASGGLNRLFRKGDLMLLNDHINLLPSNPLTGKNDDAAGPRFPDMSQPYNAYMNNVIIEAAKRLSIPVHRGVYAAVAGPNLETRAEYRFLAKIGADVVGMSTVPEVIVARHVDLPCAAVSVITDECDPDNLQPVALEEIIAIARTAETKLNSLFKEVISQL